ncbi:DUF6745 domain-containing protein [Actinosynnema sp. NPDC023658]|uniref:DUF6745 domain-containing protein n=1 Tax=Actinosynnema sp. NPDC023658 TaxID=3155465 RepID=UPI0033C9020F
MSVRRRRISRPPATPPDHRWHTVELRAEWSSHALRAEPADRPATETAITALYALLGEPPPTFVWVGSPSAAHRLLPPPAREPVLGAPWPVESRLATALGELRGRLDRRCTDTTVHTGVREVLRRTVRESVVDAVRAELAESSGLVWYGQHDADWVAHYDAHRRLGLAGVHGPDADRLELWATIARSCGWWWPRRDVCVVSERPTSVVTEPVPGAEHGETRLHNGDGPALTYPDGWTVHSWHGTPVPRWVIEEPTAERILAERNVEVRRCAVERVGWEAFIDEAGLTLLARAPDPGNPGSELRLYDLPVLRPATATRLLLAVNGSVERDGTRRRYGLHVPPWFDDPVDAAGWSYGLTGAQYAQLRRRT